MKQIALRQQWLTQSVVLKIVSEFGAGVDATILFAVAKFAFYFDTPTTSVETPMSFLSVHVYSSSWDLSVHFVKILSCDTHTHIELSAVWLQHDGCATWMVLDLVQQHDGDRNRWLDCPNRSFRSATSTSSRGNINQ